jgi:hypothetical protein
MKIEIIKEVAGMKTGTVKEVKDIIAKNLINRKLAKKYTVKKKSTKKANK